MRGKINAYLTVYLTLTMTVMLSLCLALIEGVRQNTIFMETECVADIGLNSVFAEYHRELLKQYNLFAIDSSYGTGVPKTANTEAHLEEYLKRNLSTEDIFLDWLLYRDFFRLSVEGTNVTKVSFLTDEEGAVFRRRAAEAMWDDSNLGLFWELLEWLRTVQINEMTQRDIASEKRRLDEELDSYDGEERKISEKEWITIHVENPTEELEKKRREGILKWVTEHPESISRQTLSAENLISARMEAGGINKGNLKMTEVSELQEQMERFFFQEYLLCYMGHYGAPSEKKALQYQIEYLIAGKENDLENLKSLANTLCAVREVANTIYIFGDQEKCSVAEILAYGLAAFMMLPEATDLLKMIILFGWAYSESLYDVQCLLTGGRIPLMKDSSTWHYDLDMALNPRGESVKDSSVGLSYEDYLRIFMMLENRELLTKRAMDLVEADIRMTPGNGGFRLDGCIDRMEVCVSVKSAYGYNCEITRQKGYSTQ